MQICIDATSLLLRSAGVKNYVYHWMRSLQAEAPQHRITAFPLLGQAGELDHDRSMLTPLQTLPRIALLHLCRIPHSPMIDLAIGRADVFHASNLVRNVPRRAKLTGTLYDMTVMLMPELHTPGNIRAERLFYERVLKKADGLIAISQASKNDAVRLLGVNPDRVAVICPGIDERFFSATPLRRTKPYVLFVGTVEPRKNVDTLLDAWAALPADARQQWDLVIAGPRGWASEGTLARMEAGMKGVEYTGYVPERDLPSLTAGASVFVYPSLYEGFGFPLAQAMAAGVACITSNISSMPEVAGDSALLVEPRDTLAIRNALEKLMSSESLRKQMGHQGKEQAAKYAWKNSALLSAEFFERVCG